MMNSPNIDIQKILEDHQLWLSGNGGKRADFSNINLSNVNLANLNLTYACFSNIILSDVDFSCTNLANTNFNNTCISNVNFFNANLFHASFYNVGCYKVRFDHAKCDSANFSNSNLEGSDFSHSELPYSNFSNTCLINSNFYNAKLFSASFIRANLFNSKIVSIQGYTPTAMLLANWGNLSDELCRLAMKYDSSAHPDPSAFDRWKRYGYCPYTNESFRRVCNFCEKRELWDPNIETPRAWDLMVALIREKCADSDFHSKNSNN